MIFMAASSILVPSEIRITEAEEDVRDFGHLFIDKSKRKVVIRKTNVELTPKEFDLLLLLSSKPGKTYTRGELLNLVWGTDFERFEHTVNTHINRLRLKIEKDPSAPEFILTTWGIGYRFADLTEKS